MRNLLLALTAVVALAGFGGCQTPVVPQNLEQSIAYAYPTHATATIGVNEACKAGKMSLPACENALVISKQVKVSLDLAQTLVRQGKPTDAQGTFKMAMSALEGLTKFAEESKK